ncbi:MAG: ATP-binding protein [Pseudomonadota bacterium]|nr:ATP-binding protein [Pseudomonadota bacterium]
MSGQPVICERPCDARNTAGPTRFVVITGGPGAGKTTVLDMARKILCEHVAVLPEAASLVYGGGFWRLQSQSGRAAAQRAIYHVQRQLENVALGENRWPVTLCDRGTLDGLAYWPEPQETFWDMAGSSMEQEYARYAAVIHLQSPSEEMGYNHQNSLRIETAHQARELDEKIGALWSRHPRYTMIESRPGFLEKVRLAITAITRELPRDCRAVAEAAGLETV